MSKLIAAIHRHQRLSLFVALLTASTMLTGCYGRFPLVRAVYDFNGEVGAKFTDNEMGAGVINSVVMWVFAILPVYGIATWADVIILNLIEFWTGEAVTIGQSQTQGDVTVAFERGEHDRQAVMTISKHGEVLGQQTFTEVEQGIFEVRNDRGDLTGKVLRSDEGHLTLTDAQGNVLRQIENDDLAQVL